MLLERVLLERVLPGRVLLGRVDGLRDIELGGAIGRGTDAQRAVGGWWVGGFALLYANASTLLCVSLLLQSHTIQTNPEPVGNSPACTTLLK
jgi:hypothetical protein